MIMSTLLFALAALSNITGFVSGTYYETQDYHVADCITDYYGGATAKTVDDLTIISDIYNLEGSNEFIYVQFDDNVYAVYSKKEESICKLLTYDVFGECQSEFKIYSDYSLGFEFAYYDQEADGFFSVDDNVLNNNSISDYYSTQEKSAGNYYRDIDVPSNAQVITNAFYFERLGSKHGLNSKGTCTIVAAQMLLGYYDTFANDYIVDDDYDVIARQFINKATPQITDFSTSPGTDDSGNGNSRFHDYLVSIAKNEIGDDPEVNGMSTINQIKLMKNYLQKREMNFTLSTSEGNWGDIISSRAEMIIRTGIDNNRPVVSNGTEHSTVAFAYDSDYVWVHTGWGFVAATPWSTFESNMFSNYSAGCIDIVSITEHTNSDNYYAYNKNLFLSPNGNNYTSSTISPEDYEFEPQYFFDRKQKSKTIENINLTTYRLRTGYIENEFINLSAKREGAGEAHLEYWFDKTIRKFELRLSYWQISDVLSKLNSTANFDVLKYNENSNQYYWEHALDLLDINLTTDRTHQDVFTFEYIREEVHGFRFVVFSPAIGTKNSGRISIGNIMLIHTT